MKKLLYNKMFIFLCLALFSCSISYGRTQERDKKINFECVCSIYQHKKDSSIVIKPIIKSTARVTATPGLLDYLEKNPETSISRTQSWQFWTGSLGAQGIYTESGDIEDLSGLCQEYDSDPLLFNCRLMMWFPFEK